MMIDVLMQEEHGYLTGDLLACYVQEGKEAYDESEEDITLSLATAGMEQDSIKTVMEILTNEELTTPRLVSGAGIRRIRKMRGYDKLRLGEKARFEAKVCVILLKSCCAST